MLYTRMLSISTCVYTYKYFDQIAKKKAEKINTNVCLPAFKEAVDLLYAGKKSVNNYITSRSERRTITC